MEAFADIAGFSKVRLHRLEGRNLVLTRNKSIISRGDVLEHNFAFSYSAFNQQATFAIQIGDVEDEVAGSFGFGVTTTNPTGIISTALPDRMDRFETLSPNETWEFVDNVGQYFRVSQGDIIRISFAQNGDAMFQLNETEPIPIFRLREQSFWAYVAINGAVKEIRLAQKRWRPSWWTTSSGSCTSGSWTDAANLRLQQLNRFEHFGSFAFRCKSTNYFIIKSVLKKILILILISIHRKRHEESASFAA